MLRRALLQFLRSPEGLILRERAPELTGARGRLDVGDSWLERGATNRHGEECAQTENKQTNGKA